MIINNENLDRSQVRDNSITCFGVDCGGQQAIRMLTVMDCKVDSTAPTGVGEDAVDIENCTNCSASLYADLSSVQNAIKVANVQGSSIGTFLNFDVTAPLLAGTLVTLGNANSEVKQTTVTGTVRDLRSEQTAVVCSHTENTTIERLCVYPLDSETATVGLHIAASATNTHLQQAVLYSLTTPIVNASASTRIHRPSLASSTPATSTKANTSNLTFWVSIDSPIITLTGTLTADRTITLSTSQAVDGDHFILTRTGGGSYKFTVNQTHELNTGDWCRWDFHALTSEWRLTMSGSNN
jgi:hypothetical protein